MAEDKNNEHINALKIDPELGSFEEMKSRLCTPDWDDIFDKWQSEMMDKAEDDIVDFGIWVVLNYQPGPEKIKG